MTGTRAFATPARRPTPEPADHNLKAWTCDPILAPGGTTSTLGLINGSRLKLAVPATITNIVMNIGTAGVSLTAGQCFAALYTGAGALIAQTADQAASWASNGVKTMALAGGPYQRAAGDYIVVWWANGTTTPSVSRVPAGGAGLANVGLTSPNLRFFSADTSITTTGPATLGAQSAVGNCWWAALS